MAEVFGEELVQGNGVFSADTVLVRAGGKDTSLGSMTATNTRMG